MGPELMLSGATGPLPAPTQANYGYFEVGHLELDEQAPEQEVLNSRQSYAGADGAIVSGLADIGTMPDPDRRFLSLRSIGFVVALLDVCAIIVAIAVPCVAAEQLAHGTSGMRLTISGGIHSAILFVLVSAAQGLYKLPALLTRVTQLKGICWSWFLVCLLTATLGVQHLAPLSALDWVTAYVPAAALLLFSRIFLVGELRHSLSRGTLRGKRSVLVGGAEEFASFTALDLRELYAIEEVAKFTLSGQSVEATVINDIISASRARRAEQIVLALPWNDTGPIERLLEQLRVLPLTVVLIPDRAARALAQKVSQRNSAAIMLELQRAPLTTPEAAIKRTLDLIVGGALLCALLPVLILAGMAIRVDSPGPVIFRQRRRGFNGAEFKINKFRSMTVLEDGPIIIQSRPNDVRITRVGQILRQSSIDELPQLLNVLRGEMSLVGPRPHAIAHDIQYGDLVSNYAARHRIKPGITGWAQINGLRGETRHVGSMARRVDLDLWYINNWSIWLDLKILVLTLAEVVRARQAF